MRTREFTAIMAPVDANGRVGNPLYFVRSHPCSLQTTAPPDVLRGIHCSCMVICVTRTGWVESFPVFIPERNSLAANLCWWQRWLTRGTWTSDMQVYESKFPCVGEVLVRSRSNAWPLVTELLTWSGVRFSLDVRKHFFDLEAVGSYRISRVITEQRTMGTVEKAGG